MNINEFKSMSIHGRFAFCMIALENELDKNYSQLDWSIAKILFDKLWEFTSSHHLDKWHEVINIMSPFVILDENEDFGNLEYISVELAKHLKNFYQSIPSYIVSLIESIINIGVGNIYAGTGEYSELTLSSTIEALAICIEHKIALPDIEIFKQFSFSEEGGWGIDFTRNDIRVLLSS